MGLAIVLFARWRCSAEQRFADAPGGSGRRAHSDGICLYLGTACRTVKMKCGCAGKTVQFEVDPCAQAMKLICVCKKGIADVECAKARQ